MPIRILKAGVEAAKSVKEKNERKEKSRNPNPKTPTMGKMGGGMMQRPMGMYKTGTMVMARGCKLGRKKATKIT